MKRQFLAGVLALAMVGGSAFAAENAFPAVNVYPGFADVAEGEWYTDTVKLCYEVGLMKGTGDGFDPMGSISVAECVVLAARINELLTGGDGVFEQPAGAAHWFTAEMTHLQRLAHLADDQAAKEVMSTPMEEDAPGVETLKLATRQDFFTLLALAVPAEELTAINDIVRLPDTDDAGVLAFYNAGILTGTNDYGTFSPNKGLSRAEVATMAARIARSELRRPFVPKAVDIGGEDFDLGEYLLGVDGSAPYFTAGGFTVTVEGFLEQVIDGGDQLYQFCQEQGVEFGWGYTLGGERFVDTLYKWANSRSLHGLWLSQEGEVENIWTAGHILVKDKALADQLYAQLQADPGQFATLQAQYSEDGRDDNGDLHATAYTFGPDYMVSEFEEGTKALQPGEIGAPVESQYGWHIIQRLPLDREEGWSTFAGQVRLEFAPEFPDGIDVAAAYDRWLALNGR